MKNIIFSLLIIFCVNSLHVTAQNANQKRIEELQIEIKNAADAGNFEKAAELKKEKETRLAIEEALKNQDFETADKLKSSLTKPAAQTNAPKEEVKKQPQETVDKTPVSNAKPTTSVLGKKVYFYADFSPAGLAINTSSAPRLGYAVQVKIGNKFFFNSNESAFRIGLDVNWLSVLPAFINGKLNMQVSGMKVGVAGGYAFTDDLGIDFNANFGPGVHSQLFNQSPVLALVANPQVRFLYKKLSVGFDYQYFFGPTSTFSMNYIGLTIGVRR